jgi:hypothetical protein
MVFLSAGGNNVIAGSYASGTDAYTHKLVSVREGEHCPEIPADDVHSFIVTPTSYNEWILKAEKRLPRKEWNKKMDAKVK